MSNDTAADSPVRPRLWNPNAAANWSVLFTPIFGALLHAANWRVLGQPRRAAACVAWALGSVAVLVANLARVFLPESAALEDGVKGAGIGLFFGWYLTQGRSQVRYVREARGDDYERRGWRAPLLLGVAGWVAYFGLIMAAVTAGAEFRPVSAADVAKQLRPLIQEEFRRKAPTLDIRVHDVQLVHQGGDTYTGTVGVIAAQRPLKFTLTVVNSKPMLEWRTSLVPPDLGTPLSYNGDRLYTTFFITPEEANALGEYLTKCGFFDGTGKRVQLDTTTTTYLFCTPVSPGFDRDPETLKLMEAFAGELSEKVFRSKPTEIHLCDDNLVTLRVVIPK